MRELMAVSEHVSYIWRHMGKNRSYVISLDKAEKVATNLLFVLCALEDKNCLRHAAFQFRGGAWQLCTYYTAKTHTQYMSEIQVYHLSLNEEWAEPLFAHAQGWSTLFLHTSDCSHCLSMLRMHLKQISSVFLAAWISRLFHHGQPHS